MDIISEVAKRDWVKRWAGSYTFISCSYWGRQYYTELKRELGTGFSHSLFIHRKGVVIFLLPQDEFQAFGKQMAAQLARNESRALTRLNMLKTNSDKLTAIMTRLQDHIPSREEYEEFKVYFSHHLPLHNFMKKTLDFLPPDTLEKFFPRFKDARLYSEHVYSDTEKFFRHVASAIAVVEKFPAELLTCLTEKEFERYIVEAVVPPRTILEERFNESALYFEKGKQTIFMGTEALQVEGATHEQGDSRKVRGTAAFPGRVTGTVRVVLDPHKEALFNDGDILVTGMTRPEFLPFVRRAGAIVTDAGGVLCHAAIIARELHIPCVVGTEHATKTFKDGMTVEVDAVEGHVHIM